MPIGKSFKKIFLDEGFALLSSSHRLRRYSWTGFQVLLGDLMRNCYSSQKQNPFFSGNPQKLHNPFLGSVSVDEMLWAGAPDFWKNSMQYKSSYQPFVLVGGWFLKIWVISNPILIRHVMSMAFVVFRIWTLKIRYDLSRGRVGRSVSWSHFKRLEQLKKTQ